jgi:hypothetical protein
MEPVVRISTESLEKLAKIVDKGESLSEASQIILSLVPLIGVLFGTFLFFSLFYFYHKQKMLMIEQKLYKPIRLNWSLIMVLAGFIIFLAGVAITLVFILNRDFGHELLGGLIPFAVGLAILLTYFVSNKVNSAG